MSAHTITPTPEARFPDFLEAHLGQQLSDSVRGGVAAGALMRNANQQYDDWIRHD